MDIITIAKTILSKLGVTGVLLIAALCYIGVQYGQLKYKESVIEAKDKTIAENTVEIHELNGVLKTQNDAIEKLKEQTTSLQNALYVVDQKNKQLVANASTQIIQINSKPTANTCKGAMDELRTTTKSLNEKWNAK